MLHIHVLYIWYIKYNLLQHWFLAHINKRQNVPKTDNLLGAVSCSKHIVDSIVWTTECGQKISGFSWFLINDKTWPEEYTPRKAEN